MSDLLATEIKVSARRAQTRERLMVAASTVFAARGILGSSVEEICEAAGFTRGAFYSNFADKDALVLAMIQADIAQQLAGAERAIAAVRSFEGDPGDVVAQALTELEAFGRPSRESVLVQQELLLYAARQPELRGTHQAFVNQCLHQVGELLADAMQEGGLRFIVPTEQAIEMLAAAHSHMRLQSLFTGSSDLTIMHTLLLTIAHPAS